VATRTPRHPCPGAFALGFTGWGVTPPLAAMKFQPRLDFPRARSRPHRRLNGSINASECYAPSHSPTCAVRTIVVFTRLCQTALASGSRYDPPKPPSLKRVVAGQLNSIEVAAAALDPQGTP